MGLDNLLEAVYFLQQKQKALQEILDIKYAALKEELQAGGLKRYSHQVAGEEVVAAVRTRTLVKVEDAELLVRQVADPKEFAVAVLNAVSLPKKCVQALEALGVNTAESISTKKSAAYLEVKCGPAADARIREQQVEYYAGLQQFCDSLRTSITLEESAKLVSLEPVFLQKQEEEAPDATEVLD